MLFSHSVTSRLTRRTSFHPIFMCVIKYSSKVVTMPGRGRGNIGRRSQHTTQQRTHAARRTEEESATARESARIRMIGHRALQSQEAHEAYNEQQRFRRRQDRAHETHETRAERVVAQRQHQQQQ